MILLQLVVLTIVASCKAKHEHLEEPAPQRINPQEQGPGQQISSLHEQKPPGTFKDDDLDQSGSAPKSTHSDQEGTKAKRAAENRNDQSKAAEEGKILKPRQVQTHHRMKRRKHQLNSLNSVERILLLNNIVRSFIDAEPNDTISNISTVLSLLGKTELETAVNKYEHGDTNMNPSTVTRYLGKALEEQELLNNSTWKAGVGFLMEAIWTAVNDTGTTLDYTWNTKIDQDTRSISTAQKHAKKALENKDKFLIDIVSGLIDELMKVEEVPRFKPSSDETSYCAVRQWTPLPNDDDNLDESLAIEVSRLNKAIQYCVENCEPNFDTLVSSIEFDQDLGTGEVLREFPKKFGRIIVEQLQKICNVVENEDYNIKSLLNHAFEQLSAGRSIADGSKQLSRRAMRIIQTSPKYMVTLIQNLTDRVNSASGLTTTTVPATTSTENATVKSEFETLARLIGQHDPGTILGKITPGNLTFIFGDSLPTEFENNTDAKGFVKGIKIGLKSLSGKNFHNATYVYKNAFESWYTMKNISFDATVNATILGESVVNDSPHYFVHIIQKLSTVVRSVIRQMDSRPTTTISPPTVPVTNDIFVYQLEPDRTATLELELFDAIAVELQDASSLDSLVDPESIFVRLNSSLDSFQPYLRELQKYDSDSLCKGIRQELPESNGISIVCKVISEWSRVNDVLLPAAIAKPDSVAKGKSLVQNNDRIFMSLIKEMKRELTTTPEYEIVRLVKNGIYSGINSNLEDKVTHAVSGGKTRSQAINDVAVDISSKTVTRAIKILLTYRQNTTYVHDFNVDEYRNDSIKYSTELLHLLNSTNMFDGNTALFDVLKEISMDNEVILLVSRMLNNTIGYNVTELAMETARNLVKQDSSPTVLEELMTTLGNQSLKTIPPRVMDAINDANEKLNLRLKEEPKKGVTDVGFEIGESGNDAVIKSMLKIISSMMLGDPTYDTNEVVNNDVIGRIIKGVVLHALPLNQHPSQLVDLMKGLALGVVKRRDSPPQLIHLLHQIQAKAAGMNPYEASKYAAKNDYLKNHGRSISQLMSLISKLLAIPPVEALGPNDILLSRLKKGNITVDDVVKKIGKDWDIGSKLSHLLTNEFSNGSYDFPPVFREEAERYIDEMFSRYDLSSGDFGDYTKDSLLKIAQSTPKIIDGVAKMLHHLKNTTNSTTLKVAADVYSQTEPDLPNLLNRLVNEMEDKMSESFPLAADSQKKKLKETFEKMFKELEKYAKKQDSKNYTAFGETFGKGQAKQASKVFKSITDGMKVKTSRRLKRAPSAQSVEAMNGFVDKLLNLIGIATGASNLGDFLEGIANGADAAPAGSNPNPATAVNNLNTQAGTSSANARTKGGNGATKDVGLNNGANSENMGNALQEGLSNMNADDGADDDDDGGSLWWIGLIIGILVLIIVIIVIILLLRKKKKEEPVVVAAVDMVSETMTTFGIEVPLAVVTSVVTTTTTTRQPGQPGQPATDSTQSSDGDDKAGGEQVININVIHVNQDNDESSTEDVESEDEDPEQTMDGHILTDTEQSEDLYKAEGKHRSKEKKQKKKITKSEKKQKLEDKQKKGGKKKGQDEDKRDDDDNDKDDQPRVIVINDVQPKSDEKQMENKDDNEANEKENDDKKEEERQILIIRHQHDGPKSEKEDDDKPKSHQAEKKGSPKNSDEKLKKTKKNSLKKVPSEAKENKSANADEKMKSERSKSPTKAKANDKDKKIKRKKSAPQAPSEPKKSISENDRPKDRKTQGKPSTTNYGTKADDNDSGPEKEKKGKKERRKAARKPSTKPGEVKPEKKSEKSQSNEAQVKEKQRLNEKQSKTQATQLERKQSEGQQKDNEFVRHEPTQKTVKKQKSELFAEPNYEPVIHKGNSVVQVHTGQDKVANENEIPKKVTTVITTTDQEAIE